MEIKKIIVGDLETNCYILTKDNECIIIDPGDEFDLIKEAVGNKKVIGVLVTHFHPDHIGALEEIISKYEVDVNKPNFGNFEYELIETPGHTFDSKTIYFKKLKIMFTGDFIFYHSIGRTDLGGSNRDMKKSLEEFQKYDDNIKLYPGHGKETTLGEEKKYFSTYYN